VSPAPTTVAEPRATIGVTLAARSYEVVVGPGLMSEAADLIAARLGPAKCAIVTDSNVAARHLPGLEAALRACGRHAGSVVLAPGEATKSFAALAGLCEHLLAMGLELRSAAG
jgi:3-dehydroquinate synthetase